MSSQPLKENSPANLNHSGYQAKVNLLRQIDDAASQYGGGSRANSTVMSTNY